MAEIRGPGRVRGRARTGRGRRRAGCGAASTSRGQTRHLFDPTVNEREGLPPHADRDAARRPTAPHRAADLPGQAARRRPGRSTSATWPRRWSTWATTSRCSRASPTPSSTSGSRSHKLPSLDIYNDHFPMRMPGVWELKTWPTSVEVGTFIAGHVPRAAGLLHAGLPGAQRPARRLRPGPRQPEPRLRPARPSSGLGLPLIATIHHPITVDRRLEMEHAHEPLQEAHRCAAGTRFTRHADRGRPPPQAGHHRVGELLRGHRHRPQGAPRPHAHRAGGRRPRPVPAGHRGHPPPRPR